MTAGLPGVGIGGIFYLISALLMPVHELFRLVRGESSVERWRLVARQWVLAAGILAGLWGTGWGLGQLLPREIAGPGSPASSIVARNVIEISALGLSLGTLMLVLLAVQIARPLMRSHHRSQRADLRAIALVTDPTGSTQSGVEVVVDPDSDGHPSGPHLRWRRSGSGSTEAG